MSQVTEQSVRFQTALASIKLIQASAVLDLTEDDFDFLTSNKVWIATDRSRSEERFSRNAETDLVCRLLLEKKKFAGRIQELLTGHPSLQVIADALLAVHAVLLREFNGFEQRVRIMARADAKAELLMSTPAVGPIVALTYACAIDDPARFKSSKQAGAHFGLTPKKYQSGETDYTGRTSKIGDAAVREALYQAAHVMLTKPVKGCAQLKSWAMRIAKRAGMKKAKVALARKLAVIMHRMLADGRPFNPTART